MRRLATFIAAGLVGAAQVAFAAEFPSDQGRVLAVAGFAPTDESPANDQPASPEPPAAPTLPASFLQVREGRFVDAQGRQVLLHGMNVISKSKSEGYLSWHRPEDFARMRAWGMNCVRLGVLWDGVEPEPGRFDEDYLDEVARRVAWAGEQGLYVVLDMHQDLFSVLFGDGAPAWATLSEGQPHVPGGVWSDAYLSSPAVQAAFDRFWANAPAPDGVGIQDHYAAAWRHVAERFAGNPHVVGYDLMNEPFQGSSAVAALAGAIAGEFGTELARRLGDRAASRTQIAALWKTADGRAEIMKHLEDLALYKTFLKAQTGASQAFERQRLQAMYQRVACAIRAVDRHHVLLLEPSFFCNFGVTSALEPVAGPQGEPDPQQAYAPHAYDIVVDTPAMASANADRIDLIFDRHARTAGRLGMPMILGEWGAFGEADERVLASARLFQRQIESHLCSDVFWEYYPAMEQKAYFTILKRSIPSRIAGTLLEYANDLKTGAFVCRWREKPRIGAPTVVYLTEASLGERTVHLEPKGAGFRSWPARETTGDVFLTIPPTGKSVDRSLILK